MLEKTVIKDMVNMTISIKIYYNFENFIKKIKIFDKYIMFLYSYDIHPAPLETPTDEN
jgi:hypothetical protein